MQVAETMPQDATVEGLSVMDEISPVVTTDATAKEEAERVALEGSAAVDALEK
ncbi:MAG: hypothetical protein ABGX68_08165 [Methylococcales bacterium]